MDVDYVSRKLERVLNTDRLIQKEYGQQAPVIKRRLAVLWAAPSLAHIPTQVPEKCHPLKGKREGQYAVWLKHPFRLVFRPRDLTLPELPNGDVDLDKITAVTVMSIEDYH